MPEYIKHADGSIQRTPAHDTLVNVGKHDIIYPNFDAMMRSLAMPAITGLPADNMTQQIGSFAERVEHAVKMQTPLLQTIANKKELSLGADNSGMTAIHRWSSRQVKYIDETTNW